MTGVKSQDLNDFVAQALVLAEMARDELKVRAELPGSPARHPGRDPTRSRLVGCSQDDACSNGNRSGPKPGIE